MIGDTTPAARPARSRRPTGAAMMSAPLTAPPRLRPFELIGNSVRLLFSPGAHRDWGVTSLPHAVGFLVVGLPLMLVLPHVLVGMGTLHTALARRLLAPTREEALEQRVDALTVSRARMMDAVLAERRRIE